MKKDVFILTPHMLKIISWWFPMDWKLISRKWKNIYYLCLLSPSHFLKPVEASCHFFRIVHVSGQWGDLNNAFCAKMSFVALVSTPVFSSCDPAQLRKGFWWNDPWFPPTTWAVIVKIVLPVYFSDCQRQLWIIVEYNMSLLHVFLKNLTHWGPVLHYRL